VRDVLDWLARRGFGDVQAVTAAQESLLFALPTELRRDLKAAGHTVAKLRHDPSAIPGAQDGHLR
jgi:4-hydroxy-3-methylbut-2-en-1-yl diphosphate reductase